jgi:hypothetical protein
MYTERERDIAEAQNARFCLNRAEWALGLGDEGRNNKVEILSNTAKDVEYGSIAHEHIILNIGICMLSEEQLTAIVEDNEWARL